MLPSSQVTTCQLGISRQRASPRSPHRGSPGRFRIRFYWTSALVTYGFCANHSGTHRLDLSSLEGRCGVSPVRGREGTQRRVQVT